jgi:hypothetical protein
MYNCLFLALLLSWVGISAIWFFHKPKSLANLTDAELEQEKIRVKRNNVFLVLSVVGIFAFYLLLYKLS